jgi:hypothetical protein
VIARVILLFLAAFQARPADGWWDRAWAHRRRLSVRNNLEEALKAGHQVRVDIDPEFLGLPGKARPDLSDLTVVHSGRAVPSALLPSREKGRWVLWFRAAADIPPAAADPGYAIYYGHPAAPAPPAGAVFDFFEDFSRPDSIREKFEVEPDLKVQHEDGALVIRDVAAGRPPGSPARLTLKGALPGEGFALSFDLEVRDAAASALAFSADVELREAGSGAPEDVRRIDGLIEKLGDDSWEAREKATEELIRAGKAAIPKLQEAAKSADAEVKWRAVHALREIQERNPPSVISAGIVTGDPQVGPAALSWAIGKNRGRARLSGGGLPLRLHVEIRRDPDGEATVLWDAGKPQTGRLPGPVERISLGFSRGAAGAPGTVRLDNLFLRRHVDEDGRPTTTLEVEEGRP